MLNPKQERFASEYIVDLNATKAAERAGYSKKTAYSQGQRLLKHVEVAALIARLRAEAAERTKSTADDVVIFLSRTMNDRYEATRERLKAAELLAKHHGLLINRHEITGADGGPIRVEDARDALAARLAAIAQRRATNSGYSEPEPEGS